MNEEAAVILAGAGQPDAIRSIYDQHGQRIYRIAYRHTRSRQDAEDILQDTFIKAIKRLRSNRVNTFENLASWLNTICINCCIDFFRRQNRHQRDFHMPYSELHREPVSLDPTPESTAEIGLDVEKVRRAMTVLSPKQRVMFDMRFSRHMAIGEIAAALDCSQSNVKTQIGRALTKLRTTLEPFWRKA